MNSLSSMIASLCLHRHTSLLSLSLLLLALIGALKIHILILPAATISSLQLITPRRRRKMKKLRPAWAVKAIFVIVLTSALFRCVSSANITVGGASGWDLRSNIQAWASTTTFNVGDDLVFSYTPANDVVEVNQQGYDTCTIANALAAYDTGETVIHLTGPGIRYFVCGRMGHCQQGLKLEVQVLAQPNNATTNTNNNGTSVDQNPDRNRRSPPPRSPPPRSPPPRSPPPRHPPPTPLASPPKDIPADAPCHCSRAEEKHHGLLMVPLITIVIILGLLSPPPLGIFPVIL